MSGSLVSVRRIAIVGGLALGAVACGGADSGTVAGGEPGAASGGTEAVAIADFKFAPPDIEVAPGTEVTWTNEDTFAHTVQDDGGLFPETADLAQGETFSHTYERAGTYPYICGVHPYMKGTVTVS